MCGILNIMENKSNILDLIISYIPVAVFASVAVILPATLAYASHGAGAAIASTVFYTGFWGVILWATGK